MLTTKKGNMQIGGGDMQVPEIERGNSDFAAGSAANAAYFDRNQMQARRLRRQNRLSRVGGPLKVGGWSVSSW